MKSIYNDVFKLVEAEKSAISKKAFNVLNAEGIADITENNGVFWFESYSMSNSCSKAVYDYIDGAGYSFYDEHWIPLYKARGLQWHETEGTEVA